MCSVKDKSVILCSFLTIFIHGHLLVLNQAFIDSQEVVLLKRNIRSLYERPEMEEDHHFVLAVPCPVFSKAIRQGAHNESRQFELSLLTASERDW